MAWTEADLQYLFPPRDWERGVLYFCQGAVQDLQIEGPADYETVQCVVQGTRAYHVEIHCAGEQAAFSCTCPRYRDTHSCKHAAAAMLAYFRKSRRRTQSDSDFFVKQMLRTYADRAAPQQGQIRLAVQLHRPASRDYPTFSLRVGADKLYNVRDIRAFAGRVARGETFSYGKGLSFCHTPEQFDLPSQALIALLLDQFPAYRAPDTFAALLDPGTDSLLWPQGQKNRIRLLGSAFDRWFDLLREQPLAVAGETDPIALADGNPPVVLSLQKQPSAAALRLSLAEGWTLFGNARHCYALNAQTLLRCDAAFCARLQPLLRGSAAAHRISYADLPVFCSCVLPELEALVEVRDPDGLLQTYLPDPCTMVFYLDLEGDTLRMSVALRYGETEVPLDDEVPASIKRNLRAEQTAGSLAAQYFRRDDTGAFRLSDFDAAFAFLTGALAEFQRRGEVYLSERLRARRLQPSPAHVGISVSEGLLRLDLDTGGFPPEELEALYQSLLKKRRYHRLADGRFLPLDGSAPEKLAELAHTLQLTPQALARGAVELPAFRGPYLDSLLAEEEGIDVRRDQQFRAMVRSFKSVAESDFALPDHLEPVLRPYQKTGFRWLKTLESCGFGGILADEMGLGKTAQVIAFLATVTSDLPSLVVCPASLVLNWKDELEKFAPALRVRLILGPAAARRTLLAAQTPDDVWVTSYELLRQDLAQYREKRFYCCILDEAQHIKNQSTLISKAVKQIDCRQRFVLTGTPIENRLSELWNLFDFLMPGYLFSHQRFVEKLEKPVVKSRDPEAAAQLRRLVQPFLLRRLKRDVLRELPPKVEYVRRIPLSEEERRVYHAAALQVLQSFAGEGRSKLAVLAALTQLRQICCAPGLCFANYQGPSSKLEAALELCAGMVENGHQVLLFSQFTSMLDLIRPRLDALGISSFTLEGATSKEQRSRLVKAFNAGAASVFLISLKAGGTGLNLTAADVVIHYDPWWNLAAQDQATDRTHRIGQRASVQVYKLITQDTIEERILELQAKKAQLMDTIAGDSEGGILQMSQEELLALLA